MAGRCPEKEMTMKKDEKKKYPRGTSIGRDVVRDWQPLFTRLQDAIEWALDIAVRLAKDDDDEIEAIERVRDNMRAWLEGRHVEIDVNDVLTTLAILFAAIELDTGIDSSPMLTPLRTFPTVLHLPGAARNESPTVVIRRFPRHRNASGVFTQLAA
jgi:hypothetical protein